MRPGGERLTGTHLGPMESQGRQKAINIGCIQTRECAHTHQYQQHDSQKQRRLEWMT